jgi:hypothetical protein
MDKDQVEHIRYIFNTELEKIDKKRLAENKGLSALCLLYKTTFSKELSKNFGDNINLGNITTASVPEFISEISKYTNINLAEEHNSSFTRKKN